MRFPQPATFLLCCFMFLASAPGAEAAQESRHLTPGTSGQVVESEMGGDEVHRYQVELEAEGHWLFLVEQQDVDVVVEVAGPQGPLATVDSPTSRRGNESVLLEGAATGTYQVEVRGQERLAPGGRYRMEIRPLYEVDPESRRRIAAEAAMTAGAKLYSQKTRANWSAAIAKYEEALSNWRALGEDRDVARTLYRIGALNRLIGEHRKALHSQEEALALWRGLGEPFWEAGSLNEMGLSLSQLGEHLKARDSFQRALQIRQRLGDLYSEVITWINVCWSSQQLGESRRALECYENALPLTLRAGTPAYRAAVYVNLGGIYQNLGEPTLAAQSFDASLVIYRSLDGPRREALTANVLNNLAVLHRNLGETQQALSYYDAVLAIRRRLGDPRGEATALNNLGYAYLSLGDEQRALSYFRQALELRLEVEDKSGEAITRNNLGLVYQSLGDYDRALEEHGRALELRLAAGDPRRQAISRQHLGRAYAAAGDLATAMTHFDRALELLDQVVDRPNEAAARHWKGRLHRLSGDPNKALVNLEKALELRRRIGYQPGEAETLYELARAQHDLGHLHQARLQLQASVALIESLRAGVHSPELRTFFLASQRQAYELYMDVLMELHRAEPTAGHAALALEVSERARARTLVELLTDARAQVSRGIEPATRDRHADLLRRFNAKGTRQLKLLAQPPSETQAQEAELVEQERYAIQQEIEQVEAEIYERNPDYPGLGQKRVLGRREIQGLLDEDTVLLEYALGEERSFGWMVGKDSLSSFVLPSRQDLEDAVLPVYRGLKTLQFGNGREKEAASLALSQLLLGPVREQLDGRRLLIVGDGVLNYLPFGALPLPSGGQSGASMAPLLGRHEVVYLPSASALAMARQRRSQGREAPRLMALVADPVFSDEDPRVKEAALEVSATSPRQRLDSAAVHRSAPSPGPWDFERLASTRREAEAIAALAGQDEVLLALGFDAHRDLVVGGELGRYRMIHLATHGLIDARRPELSRLVFAQLDGTGQPRQGFVGVRDIYNLDLQAELVVLSGCETALGKEIRGEGLVGLTRGFMYAGVPRVVASLWRVPERATTELMTRFYNALLVDGLAPSAALRQAQLSIRQNPRWRAPYYWAAFVLQGDWR